MSEVPHGNVSKVIRAAGPHAWQGIPLEAYKPTTDTYKGVTRRELVGKRGESPRFHVRYFEVEPGGFTTWEKHEHEHVVIVQRGTGHAVVGTQAHAVTVGDIVYVSPSDPHQFRCPVKATEPFGFLCLVNAERDRPVPVEGYGLCEVCE